MPVVTTAENTVMPTVVPARAHVRRTDPDGRGHRPASVPLRPDMATAVRPPRIRDDNDPPPLRLRGLGPRRLPDRSPAPRGRRRLPDRSVRGRPRAGPDPG